MAIVQEIEGEYWHTYSDAGKRIKGGRPEGIYDEAYDTEQLEYVETDEMTAEAVKGDSYYAAAGRILLGEED